MKFENLFKQAMLMLIAFLPGKALADCRPQDFPLQQIELSQTDDVFRLTYLNQVSRQSFEEMKKGGSLSFVTPGFDLPTSLSYEDFRKVVNAEAKNQKIMVTQLQSNSLFRSYVSKDAVGAYVECLKRTSVDAEVVFPQEAMSTEEFFVSFTWRGPIKAGIGKFDAIGPEAFQVLGGDIIRSKFNTNISEIASGQTIKVPVKRDLSKAFSVSGSVEGYSADASLPPQSVPSTLKYEVVDSENADAKSDGNNKWADTGSQKCVKAASNELLLPSTAVAVDVRWEGEDRGRVWSKIDDTKSSKIVCVSVHSHVSRRDYDGAVSSHVSVVKIVFPADVGVK